MDLRSLINELQRQRLHDSDAALKNIANSEKYLQQSYEGRYLFELIQNVRDANKQAKTIGSVFIELKEGFLTVSNTGSPFNEKGVNSITTIGDSPKESQEFIGFKGIGFKSVHELSETPSIVTEWGSIVFDKNRSKELLNGRNFKPRDTPLFFIPHFQEEALSYEELQRGIVTKVVLPLKSNTNPDSIQKAFQEIGIHQLLLLGSLEHIELKNGDTCHKFTITTEKNDRVILTKDDQTFAFKHFKPTEKISIPQTIIETLEDKEREIYEKDPFVDISLLFDLDENNRFLPNNESKLYLFYPTEITSGFNFIIHSYFLVSPDRKVLRHSLLNKFILQKIAEYIAEEWLVIAKRNHSSTFLDFLAFERNNQAAILNHLHNTLIKRLLEKKFIYDRQSKKYYYPREIMVADGFNKGLFPDNQLNGKRLIYIQNERTRDWLLKEFGIEYLSYSTIADNIERECERQRNKKNFKFFENLYRYLVEYDDLNLKERKVLLTSKLRLLNSEDYVFYGFKEKIQFPTTIANKISFIHPAIKISDQRQGKGQTGFVEYNTELLARRLIRLYEDPKVPKIDILTSLLNLKISDRLYAEIRPKVFLPVKGNKWLNPVQSPIYLESSELLRLYPKERFLDISALKQFGIPENDLIWKLRQLGVWEIPGIYFSNRSFVVYSNDQKFRYIINRIRAFSTPHFNIQGDWLFDSPLEITKWFTETIIANWQLYFSRISEETNTQIYYRSQTSDRYELSKEHWIHLSSVLKYFREERWIKIDSDDKVLCVKEVVGIDPIESIQISALLFKKYLKVIEIHYASNRQFISLIEMSHLDGQSFLNFKRIFSVAHENHKQILDIEKEFTTFYNKLQSKLFDYYFLCTIKDQVNSLTDCKWLGVNEITQCYEWKNAKELYYIEDKPSYEILPDDIKQLIQPHFTNRDKNRFGQIGKRIGLNFKQTVEQRLVNVRPIETIAVWEFLPSFSEALALTEVLLETNLDTRLEDLKTANVIICENFEIELYKDQKYISSITGLAHKIERDESLKVYVQSLNGVNINLTYANVMHDLLVEILSRDIHAVRLTLNDFYTRSSRHQFISRYEVSQDRVDEIEAKLKGFSISKVQSFWLAILRLKNIPEYQSFLVGNGVNFEKLMQIFEMPLVDFGAIDYDRIYKVEHLKDLQSLFSRLKINLLEFNSISNIKIDFKDYFVKLFDGLRFSYKKNFEITLYDFLRSQPIDIQSSFQDTVDKYSNLPGVTLSGPLLDCDVKEYFFQALSNAYPQLAIVDKNVDTQKDALLDLYRTNEISFKKIAKTINPNVRIIDEFLEINKNRSLLYFPGTLNELRKRFQNTYGQTQGNKDNGVPSNRDLLSKYLNLPGTKIEERITTKVVLSPKSPSNTGGTGKRIDGSINSPEAELSGMVGEKMVFEMLSVKFSTSEWVSKNAAKAGVNPEGSDSHGCDIKYIDDEGQPQYVEVKSSTIDDKHFFVSFFEYSNAIKYRDNYHFYLVLFSLDNSRRKILHLKNIFMLADGQELFDNDRFTANFSNLEIRFL